jgi:aryl-alcohol dehydrogenase-like predicted oxidoreductase
MKYVKIPNTDIEVSKICLGTMTFGNQNTQQDGFDQMDIALDRGVNFFDTAELYPVPANAETYADTERIIGNWFQQTGKRDQVVLATKIAGPGDYTKHIRTSGFDSDAIRYAVDQSLKRLKTDYIDLYQLHWPERMTNMFGIRGFKHQPEDPWENNFEAILKTLSDLISEGKIRQIGLSNETPWGVMKYLELSHKGLPRMATIQNPYSLLNRTFEVGNAEVSMRENIGLLAYSPLAFGVLSGKYLHGKQAANSLLELFPRMSRYSSEAWTNTYRDGTCFCDFKTLCNKQYYWRYNLESTA